MVISNLTTRVMDSIATEPSYFVVVPIAQNEAPQSQEESSQVRQYSRLPLIQPSTGVLIKWMVLFMRWDNLNGHNTRVAGGSISLGQIWGTWQNCPLYKYINYLQDLQVAPGVELYLHIRVVDQIGNDQPAIWAANFKEVGLLMDSVSLLLTL